jgi:hypothetical protein
MREQCRHSRPPILLDPSLVYQGREHFTTLSPELVKVFEINETSG